MGGPEPFPGSVQLPRVGRIVAVDPGQKRIGLAISDPSQSVAQPLVTLTRRTGRRFPLRDFLLQIEQHSPSGILMGVPLSPDGSQTAATQSALELGSLIGEKAQLPIAYWDERMSTARVHQAIRELGGGTRGRKEDIDRLAATVLLQSYLDSRRQ